MRRIGASLGFLLAVVSGCSASESLSPLPSKVDDLLALARLQDPASVGEMEDALRTGTKSEREMAAFALGQLGVAWEPTPGDVLLQAEEALVEVLTGEREAEVRDRIIEALGKVGAAATVDALPPLLEDSAPANERMRAAIALGLVARRSEGELVSAAARDAMARMLQDSDATVRYGGAYGLLRYRDPAAKGALIAGLQDTDVHVRSTCARAMSIFGDAEDVPALAPLLEDEDDRVAAEAARTLTKQAVQCTSDDCPALSALLTSPGPWRAAVMQAVSFETWIDARALPLFQARFDEYTQATSLEPMTRALLECQAALGHDRANGAIELLDQCGVGEIEDAQRDVLKARALAPTGGPELEALLQNPVASVRVAAADGAPASALPELLADPDPAVVGAAAGRAEALEAVEVALDLVQALLRVDGPDALEAKLSLLSAAGVLDAQDAIEPARELLEADPYALRQAAAHALTQLTGEPLVPRLPSSLDAAPEIEPTIVRLNTTRGTLRIRLLEDDAPRTAQNFLDLVNQGFYDGLTMHRVVPNFVSQGGDPRGDGWGGPGYTIPCEINLHRHGEATVGMALAGRDTGGSQFFVDHSPQPHLDGLYTTFGEVIEGIEVATGLLEGDVILDASVE